MEVPDLQTQTQIEKETEKEFELAQMKMRPFYITKICALCDQPYEIPTVKFCYTKYPTKYRPRIEKRLNGHHKRKYCDNCLITHKTKYSRWTQNKKKNESKETQN